MKKNACLFLMLLIMLTGCANPFSKNNNQKQSIKPYSGEVIEISDDNEDVSDNGIHDESISENTDKMAFDLSASSNGTKKKVSEDELSKEEKIVERIISGMSLEEKLNQMMVLEFRQWDDGNGNLVNFEKMNKDVRDIVATYKPGGIILFSGNLKSVDKAFDLVTEFQDAAISRGGQPLFIATDHEGGKVYRLGSGTILPGNMAIAATGNVQNAYKAGKVIGSELSALGINTNFAPIVDVNTNPLNPVIGLRSFSDDPQIVSSYASEIIRGMDEYGVISCLKHFPGHGDTENDSHYDLPKVDKSLEELKKCELLPYEKLSGKTDVIMTAHVLFPEIEKNTIYSEKTKREEYLPATMSDDILTGLLKQEMGFEGIVITDAMNMNAIMSKWDATQAIEIAVSAGADMICMPLSITSKRDVENYDKLINKLAARVESGELSEDRIDDAVRRILRVKHKNGILDFNFNDYSIEMARSVVGCENNKNIESEIASLAVTLVKNNDNILPLNLYGDSKVLMLAPSDNELGQLAMGWNKAVSAGNVPSGAEVRILKLQTSSDNKSEDLKSEMESFIEWSDYVIMLSEIADIESTDGAKIYNTINDLLKFAMNCNKSVIIISCDKPYDIVLYDDADAILATYGASGATIDPTEVLISGITSHEMSIGANISAAVESIFGVSPFSGRLPVNIPEYDVTTGDFVRDKIMFKRGYGLR